MKLTYEIIKEKALKAKLHPKFLEKKESVCSISGVDFLPVEEFAATENLFKKQLEERSPVILLSPEDLFRNGTSCGNVGNKCFNKEVIHFLKESKVTDIFVSLNKDDNQYVILGSEMNISQKNAEKLSNLIEKNHGSWRNDVGTSRGWSSFETE